MSELRKSTQFQLPQKSLNKNPDTYCIYPTHTLEANKISEDRISLFEIIQNQKLVLIDGYQGVFFDEIKSALQSFLNERNLMPTIFPSTAFMKNEKEIELLIQKDLGGDDPLFGKRTDLALTDFYKMDLVKALRLEDFEGLTIVIGPGAFLFAENAFRIYIDLPKNEMQYRARAKSISNLGSKNATDSKKMYKRFYFVDWVVLNKHKQDFVNQIDIIADGQWEKSLHWIWANDFKTALKKMSQSVFRVRPWFEPGTWGGNWCLKNIKGLNSDVPNYAWSFELIVPENGLILESSDILLEVSFDFLMFYYAENVLGKAFDEFKTEFPIRFDFLDTFDGGNLSVQCHPQKDYTKEVFGENFTQEETYYILDCKEDAEVYLGFQDTIIPAEFESVLRESFDKNIPVDIEKFVQKHKAEKHDLFLIPPGTIHASGKNNLVLEISSTPYIFTFKMYDWLRPDLDGKPRPLNIDRGMQNLNFDRKGRYVKDFLKSKPSLIESTPFCEVWHLPTHSNHLYDVHRIELDTEMEIFTNNKCFVMSLVEGERIILEFLNGERSEFHYAETFVIPAATESFKLINLSSDRVKVIKAFVK